MRGGYTTNPVLVAHYCHVDLSSFIYGPGMWRIHKKSLLNIFYLTVSASCIYGNIAMVISKLYDNIYAFGRIIWTIATSNSNTSLESGFECWRKMTHHTSNRKDVACWEPPHAEGCLLWSDKYVALINLNLKHVYVRSQVQHQTTTASDSFGIFSAKINWSGQNPMRRPTFFYNK